jgi:hypothetical protein
MARGRLSLIQLELHAVIPAVLLGSALSLSVAQEHAQPSVGKFRVDSNLVLIDVMESQKQGEGPPAELQRDDFRVFDNGQPVAIKTFDVGSAAHPMVLWFLVQCNMQGWETKGSGLFRGQIDHFMPGMKKLGGRDLVAVAHWCDDGAAEIDLKPTIDFDKARSALEAALTPVPDPPSHDRVGELALQNALGKIVAACRELPAGPVPVVFFLYGDYSAMPRKEADGFVDALLQTSAVVYGLKDLRSPHFGSFWFVEQGEIAHYLAVQTGGRYYAEAPDRFGTAFEAILDQLHSRYEIGFRPEVMDGKRHRLRVELSEAAKRRYGDVFLRYRLAYIPVSAKSLSK